MQKERKMKMEEGRIRERSTRLKAKIHTIHTIFLDDLTKRK